MRQRLVLLAGVGTILVILAVVVASVVTRHTSPRAERNTFRVDENSPEVRALMLKAVKGSADAATLLMIKYSRCHKMEWPSEGEHVKCLNSLAYWTDVALQNGSPTAAQYHTAALLNSRRCLDAYRAEFWFKRFKHAYTDHPRFLSSVAEEIEMNQASCTW